MIRSGGRILDATSLGAIVLGSLVVLGCSTSPSVDKAMASGEYGSARERLAGHLQDNKSNRNYILDRERLILVSLADGHPQSAELATNERNELLRTQGVNKDLTVPSIILVEDIKVWKGEPFEQALGFYYVALQKAMLGEWDNARAAAQSSLFLLRDFGENENGERLTTEEVARIAAQREKAAKKNKNKGEIQDYIDYGYQPIETDFALGYLMNGVANHVIGRDREASDNFRKAVDLNVGLRAVTRVISSGRANTLLIVDYGQGPKKVRYGVDNAFSKFEPRTLSAYRPLFVEVAGRPQQVFEQACDLNTMAQDHMWNNMEDVRVAKSRVGSALLVAGAATAAASGNSRGAAYAGLAMMLAGAIMKATSAADIRYCDLLPQSIYFAPVHISAPDTSIDIRVGNDPASHIVLDGIDPPVAYGRLQVLYVRPALGSTPLPWADNTDILYDNDYYEGEVDGPDLPYILGGRCVCVPSNEVLAGYQRAGFLQDMTLTDLENLYREEGIMFTVEEHGGIAGRHILEGGNSLVCPLTGSTSYERLFGQHHQDYKPTSDRCKMLAKQIANHRIEQEALATTIDHGTE